MASEPFAKHILSPHGALAPSLFTHSQHLRTLYPSDHSIISDYHQLKLGDYNMHSEAHIHSLSEKHSALDERILTEESRPAPDSTILHELKKEKLILKDELTRLKTQ